MWELIDADPPADRVQHLTLVPFLPDGRCALILDDLGVLSVPHGGVLPGEHWLLDASFRIPMMTAGFHRQRIHPFAQSGTHLYVWVEGDRYTGQRPHVDAPLEIADSATLIDRLRAQGQPQLAELLDAATRSYRSVDEPTYFADNLRLLEPAYLRAETAEGGSGFGSGPADWRMVRGPVVDGISRDGSFLDIGCANGLLMESVYTWCAERGLRVEPYGVDIAPGLVDLARQRLPHWADRIWLGNALDWLPPDGLRFDYVHTLLDCVPSDARGRLVEHLRRRVARPGGRLLISHYVRAGAHEPSAAHILSELGYSVVGESEPPTNRPGTPPQTAWLDT